jgi:hypothetical protein
MCRSAAPMRFCMVFASRLSAMLRLRAAITRAVTSRTVSGSPLSRSASRIARPISPLNAA